MIVDLPEPVGPTRKTNSPRRDANVACVEADVAAVVDLRDAAELDHASRRASPGARGERARRARRAAPRLVSRARRSSSSAAIGLATVSRADAAHFPASTARALLPQRRSYRSGAMPPTHRPPPAPNGLPLHRIALPGTRAVDDPRRLRRRRAHRAPRGERDGALPRAPRLQGRREVYDDYRKVNETAERMGGVLNAYTSHDLVAFHITVRAESAMRGDRPADRLRRAPADRRRGARPRARRRDPGDPRAQGPAGDGRRAADRPGRVRRPPARAPRARARGAPARRSPATRSSPSASAAGRARAAARSSSATSSTSPANGAVDELFGALPDAARRRSLRAGAGRSHPQTLVEERDTNQSHLRMIYRPEVDAARPARARRADDLRDAARRLDGLAPVRRDPRAARARLLGLRDRPRASPTCRSCSSARAWTRPSASRPTRACARSSASCATTARPRRRSSARARTPPARRVLAFENTNAVARYAAAQTIVYGEEHRPRRRDRRARRRHVRRGRRGRRAASTRRARGRLRRPARRPTTSPERRGGGAATCVRSARRLRDDRLMQVADALNERELRPLRAPRRRSLAARAR